MKRFAKGIANFSMRAFFTVFLTLMMYISFEWLIPLLVSHILLCKLCMYLLKLGLVPLG
jgi:hypothetical protein